MILENDGAAGDYQIEWKRESGGDLETTEGSLQAGETAFVTPPEGAAWAICRFASEAMRASVSYRANDAAGSPALVPAIASGANRWRIFPGNWEATFDGVALVNLGSGPANVRVVQYDRMGAVLAESTAEASLASGAKLLHLIGGPGLSGFNAVSDSYIEVVSDQPLLLTSLRGNLPGSLYLWAPGARAR